MARHRDGIEPDARQRDGRDEAERRGRHGDDGSGQEVRIAEARHRSLALARGERKADEIDRLERERKRDPRGDQAHPRAK